MLLAMTNLACAVKVTGHSLVEDNKGIFSKLTDLTWKDHQNTSIKDVVSHD